jgi:hypothetical protein
MERGLPVQLARQKGMIRSIGGTPPHISLGCVTSFPPNRGVPGQMRVDAVDPPRSKEASDLPLSPGRFLRAYYEPFVAAIAQGQRTLEDDQDGLIVSAFTGHGLRVGMRSDLYAYFRTSDDADGDEELLELVDALAHQDHLDGERSDGTYVDTDWAGALSQYDNEADGEG